MNQPTPARTVGPYRARQILAARLATLRRQWQRDAGRPQTLVDAAEASDVSKSTISRAETGDFGGLKPLYLKTLLRTYGQEHLIPDFLTLSEVAGRPIAPPDAGRWESNTYIDSSLYLEAGQIEVAATTTLGSVPMFMLTDAVAAYVIGYSVRFPEAQARLLAHAGEIREAMLARRDHELKAVINEPAVADLIGGDGTLSQRDVDAQLNVFERFGVCVLSPAAGTVAPMFPGSHVTFDDGERIAIQVQVEGTVKDSAPDTCDRVQNAARTLYAHAQRYPSPLPERIKSGSQASNVPNVRRPSSAAVDLGATKPGLPGDFEL